METGLKALVALLLFAGILSLLFFLPEEQPKVDAAGEVKKMASGVEYIDKKVGKGAPVQNGKQLFIHYTGWLKAGTKADGTPKTGKMFDSSRKRGRPFPLRYGPRAGVIRGWIEGLKGMRVGGRRILIIPSRLGYGKRGAGRSIPPHADLVFDVEIVSAR